MKKWREPNHNLRISFNSLVVSSTDCRNEIDSINLTNNTHSQFDSVHLFVRVYLDIGSGDSTEKSSFMDAHFKLYKTQAHEKRFESNANVLACAHSSRCLLKREMKSNAALISFGCVRSEIEMKRKKRLFSLVIFNLCGTANVYARLFHPLAHSFFFITASFI